MPGCTLTVKLKMPSKSIMVFLAYCTSCVDFIISGITEVLEEITLISPYSHVSLHDPLPCIVGIRTNLSANYLLLPCWNIILHNFTTRRSLSNSKSSHLTLQLKPGEGEIWWTSSKNVKSESSVYT